MPRPISWLPRLHEIRRSAKNSVRSHYERKDIERLFQIQPRAAQALIQGISPSAKVGRSFLLSRADLESFLNNIAAGADPKQLLAARTAPVSRKHLGELIQVDQVTATLDTAPLNIIFETGRLAITFASMEELANSLVALAEILDDSGQFAMFQSQYLPPMPRSVQEADERDEIARLFRELEDMELTYAEHSVLQG